MDITGNTDGCQIIRVPWDVGAHPTIIVIGPSGPPRMDSPLTSSRNLGGVMRFTSEAVTYHGLQIAGPENDSHRRYILDRLKERTVDGLPVRMTAVQLTQHATRVISPDVVASTIRDMRQDIVRMLRVELDISCSEHGVIESRQRGQAGYRIAPHIVIQNG